MIETQQGADPLDGFVSSDVRPPELERRRSRSVRHQGIVNDVTCEITSWFLGLKANPNGNGLEA